MPTPTTPATFPARGKITALRGNLAVFNPSMTSYELHLEVPPGFSAPLNTPVEAVIRVTARKVWTVPSGGNFVQPIFGPPRIIQGRLRAATDTELVIQAGTHFVVTLDANTVIELPDGPMSALNNLVNVTALPGATLELLSTAAVAR